MDRKPPVRKISKPPIQHKNEKKEQNPIIRVWAYVVGFGAVLAVIAGIITNSGTIENWFGDRYHQFFPPLLTPTPLGNICGNTTNKTICIYRGHKGTVNAVAWSPNSNQIATAGSDGTVRVWDATTGNTILIYPGHKGSVNAVAWSTDGQRIASGGDDGTVQVWNADTGKLVYPPISLNNDKGKANPITTVAWSQNDEFIASAQQDGNVEIFAAALGPEDGYPITLKPTGPSPVTPRILAWSPQGNLVAIVRKQPNADQTDVVEIWNVTVINEILNTKNKLLTKTYRPFGFWIRSIAWSPNGKFIATAEYATEGYSGSVQVWIASQTNESPSIEVPVYFEHSQIDSVAWSPNSECVAMGSGFFGAVEVWNLRTSKRIDSYTGNSSSVSALAWSPDGTRIASVSSNDGVVNVWKVNQERACSS